MVTSIGVVDTPPSSSFESEKTEREKAPALVTLVSAAKVKACSSVIPSSRNPSYNEGTDILPERERTHSTPLRIELLKKRFQIAYIKQTRLKFIKAIGEHNLEHVRHTVLRKPSLATKRVCTINARVFDMTDFALYAYDPLVPESREIVELLTEIAEA